MLMYELFQKFYLLCILFLSKLLKKILKIKRVNQSEGGNTGTEIIRMTLKEYDKCAQHKASWTQTGVVSLVEGSHSCLCNNQVRGRWETQAVVPEEKDEKFKVWRKGGVLEWPLCFKKESNQLRQEKEGLQEDCFQKNNWNV